MTAKDEIAHRIRKAVVKLCAAQRRYGKAIGNYTEEEYLPARYWADGWLRAAVRLSFDVERLK